eukprot:3388883-Prymnesium_polylepis.1
MTSYFFGSSAGPSDDEKAGMVAAFVDQHPGATSGTARRFLQARDYDPQAAAAMYAANQEWLQTPIGQMERTAEIDGILASGRFRVLREGADPIIIVHFQWGHFLDGVEIETMIAAYVLFATELFKAADALRSADDPAQGTTIITGGRPPMPY